MSEVVYRQSPPTEPGSSAFRTLRLGTRRACWASPGLYYAGAKTGYLLEFSGPVAAIVWLPVGIGIAFLYLGGLAYWPGVLIGDLLANDYSVLPFGSALGQTCGNMLEVVIATLLLRRLVRHGSPLASVRGVGAIAVSIAAGAAVSATFGATSLLSGGVIGFDDVADRLADVVARRRLRRAARRAARAGLVRAAAEGLDAAGAGSRLRVLLAAVVGLADFASRSSTPVMYLVFPVLIWAALRFGQRGATLAVAITAVFTVWNVTHYARPVPLRVGHAQRAQHAALHRGRSALDAQPGGGRQRARALRHAAGALPGRALISASDNARRRLEHDLHDGAQLRLTWLALRLRDAAGIAARTESTRRARSWRRRRASCSSRSTSCGSSRTASTRRCSSISASPRRSRASRCARASRSSCSSSPSSRLNASAETVGYYVVAEAIANAQKYSRRLARSRCGRRPARGIFVLEISDDGAGGAVERPGSGLEGLRDRAEASRRHDGSSTARRAAGRASWSRSPSPPERGFHPFGAM